MLRSGFYHAAMFSECLLSVGSSDEVQIGRDFGCKGTRKPGELEGARQVLYSLAGTDVLRPNSSVTLNSPRG
jgi:hypothetical protein